MKINPGKLFHCQDVYVVQYICLKYPGKWKTIQPLHTPVIGINERSRRRNERVETLVGEEMESGGGVLHTCLRFSTWALY